MFELLHNCFAKATRFTTVSLFIAWSLPAEADGIGRNGVGARSMAMGGADVAYAADPLGAMAANPAGLGFLTSTEFDLGGNIADAYGAFNKADSGGHLDTTPGFFPDAAFAIPLGKSPVTAGISFITDSAVSANWHYNDPLSAGAFPPVSYGYQQDKSEIVVFRSALGLGLALGAQWSIGASVGLDYNENTLHSPYIFQSQPGLVGAKTLLDLRTSGLGWNGHAGVLFRPIKDLQFGLTYKSPTTIFSHGDANGDAGLQLGIPAGYPFHYDAQVKNVLPQVITAGASWKFCDDWRAALQLDWINWANAFTQLPVSLSNGHTALPASINDNVPLNWRNEFVYRAGLEYFVTTNWVLRGGYCYGGNPVSSLTLTPLTAVIMEHTLTTGVGYHWGRYKIDLAYQWDIPMSESVGTSGLQAGEYSQSSVEVGARTLSLTTGIRF